VSYSKPAALHYNDLHYNDINGAFVGPPGSLCAKEQASVFVG
jgi:hypothetical protein